MQAVGYIVGQGKGGLISVYIPPAPNKPPQLYHVSPHNNGLTQWYIMAYLPQPQSKKAKRKANAIRRAQQKPPTVKPIAKPPTA